MKFDLIEEIGALIVTILADAFLFRQGYSLLSIFMIGLGCNLASRAIVRYANRR